MQLFAKKENERTMRLLALAKISDIDVEVIDDQSTSNDMFGKIPVLDTGKGCIFASNAIGRYLARIRPDIGLYGQNFIEGGEVDSWIEYSTHELETPMCAWAFPIKKIFPEVTQATARAKLDVATCLEVLNKHLLHRTFMVGEKLTFADIHIASVLWDAVENLNILGEVMKPLDHLRRWYNLITVQPGFKAVFNSGGKAKPAAEPKAAKGAGKKEQQGKAAASKPAAKPKAEPKAKQQPKAKAEAAKKEAPAGPTPEQIKKKVLKEGGKRGVEIEGVSDMGGLNFFCTSVDCPAGDLDYTEMSVDAMNAKSDPSEEERKGGSGHVGKMIFSSDTDLACVAYVPEKLQDKTTADVWMQAMLKEMGESSCYLKDRSTKTKAFALLKGDPDKGRFGIKLKDVAIEKANAYLRTNGLFPDDESDDEEMVFGDDDFPS
ncbi:unnamed protein product [Amoebophrya sp. A120]|nr:unnamed protein product [Amoebophrya sp. A120]|eukprot:GSA120T00001987001.1